MAVGEPVDFTAHAPVPKLIAVITVSRIAGSLCREGRFQPILRDDLPPSVHTAAQQADADFGEIA
ncbi:hypothetical protein D3C74_436310 [compost metagenome]